MCRSVPARVDDWRARIHHGDGPMGTLIARDVWVPPGMPVVGPTFDLSQVQFIVVHYGAVPWSEERLANATQYWRDTHAYYTNSRGYSIGYNIGCARDGTLWELRGFDIRNAANGSLSPNSKYHDVLAPNPNYKSISLHVILPMDGSYQPKQLDGARQAVQLIRERVGRYLPVIPHSDVVETSCPSDLWRRLIAEGALEPVTPPTPPPPPPPPPLPGANVMDQIICYGTAPTSQNPAVYLLMKGGYKIWMPTPEVWNAHKQLVRDANLPAFKYRNFNADQFRAFGPVFGPKPRRVDEWGV